MEFNKAFHKLNGYYVKKGFFEAELDYATEYDCDTNEVDIVVTINEGRCGKIKNICLVGFNACEEDQIYDMLLTKEYCFYLSWLTEEGTYNPDMIQHDQMQILNFLQNEGYADAQVDIEVIEADETDRIQIIITAEHGGLYTIGRISLSGNKLYTDEEVLSRFVTGSGAPYSPEDIQNTTQLITNLYGRYGYIDCNVNYEPKLCPSGQCVYNLDFQIEEGELYRIGMIKIFGNSSTQNSVILHECLLIPGEVFNLEKMQATEERLQNIGFFRSVNIYAVKSDGPSLFEGNYRDLHIEVEETSTGKISGFVGLSTTESVFCGVDLTEANFNIAGLARIRSQGFSALRGGGEFFQTKFTVGNKTRSYLVSWTKPYFMDSQWAVGFDFEQAQNRMISDDYDINTVGFALRGNRTLNAFLNWGVHYRIRNADVTLNGHPQSDLLREEADNSGLVSAVGSSLTYNSTDAPRDPTSGFRSRLECEVAGVWGDHEFLSLGYLNTYYFPFCGKGVCKIRGDIQFILPFGNTSFHTLPLDERFFLGGEDTVRGYRPYKLGPLYPDTNDPRGGISMQIISLEYDYRFYKKFTGFIFADAGHLSDKYWNFGAMRCSWGFGARFIVLDSLPPITMGMGFPVNPKDRSEVKRFFINFGANF